MSQALKLSLVIPAYNEERYLEACLEAALQQMHRFFEIIVVDNGSSDATSAIASSFAGVRVVREPRHGIVYARNRGFRAARGDIICRIDADTILPPDWADQVAAFYRASGHERTAWTSSGRFDNVPFASLTALVYRTITFRINHWLTGYASLWGSSMALPRALWDEVSGETCSRTDIHEDLDLTTHLVLAGATVYYDAQMLVTAQLRRVWGSRQELLDYLQWWPQTLRLHGQQRWRWCWLIGVVPLYAATLLFPVSRAAARPFYSLRRRMVWGDKLPTDRAFD